MNNVTHSNNIIFNDYPDWLNEIKTYSISKQYPNLSNNQPYPIVISHKDIESRLNIFHPITQRYHDPNLNSSLISKETETIKDAIARNYDNQLRNEQTYDILTLKNKLTPFKSQINYPISQSVQIPKTKPKLNKETSKVSYNIISNISLASHHYNPPGKRPQICLSDNNIFNTNPGAKSRNKIIKRDFNIISNNYYDHHNEKMETEKEIEKYTAAKHFLRNQSYNLIKGRYFDNDKEDAYQNKVIEESKKRSLLYSHRNELKFNPVNHCVYNEEKLKEYDRNINEKKKRYALKEGIEDYYRNSDLMRGLRQEQAMNNRVSYYNYKVADERGYDILNYDNTFNRYKESLGGGKQMQTDWERIQGGVNDNQTFNSKPIYAYHSHSNDLNSNKHIYDSHRRNKLKHLPKIGDDPLFNQRIPYQSKLPKQTNPD